MPILQWLTRDSDINAAKHVPYRLLEEAPELSAGEPGNGNLLIQGDNLEALKALLPFYAGQVKCIYIDPPYNTRSAFEHYDDNLEHTQWLAMMWPRLELLRDLLSEDGSIWVSIDDNEGHYLKVIMDEVFGRRRFVANVVWQKRTSRENRAAVAETHDHILVYAMPGAVAWKEVRNLLPDSDTGYSNLDDDSRGPWRSIPFSAQGFRPNQMYAIKSPTGVVHQPPRGRCWTATEPEYLRLLNDNRIYFPNDGSGRPRSKKFKFEETGLVPMTLWLASNVGDNQTAKREILGLFSDNDPFGTPKPEKLIETIIHIATKPGDLVLDSFLGSGTTAAVAHKMGRRYIGIEMGDHAITHCAPRLKKVIEGEQGGISEAAGWKGGGGFRFYRLGQSVFDEEGHIRQDIRFPVLAAHIWFSETNTPWMAKRGTPLLGFHDGRAFALLYNGILGDKRPDGGNVLTRATLNLIREKIAKKDPAFAGPITVYGEQSRIASSTLEREGVTFKQTPYDVKEPDHAKRLGRYRGDYVALEELPGVPYVCLRLPTGGGKTILGAHAIGVARDAWIEKDYPLVLWLVPSNTIRLQTVEALKNPRHPYRQALDEVFEGRVRVFDVADFTMIRPHDIRDSTCVVVGTVQTLRVSNTEGRKVYAHNENMEPHFTGVPKTTPGLEQQEGGVPKFSFANLLHIHRPLMIVDEAHNAVTGLTREMQARVNPCAIIEFTATPRFNSNILHSVSAQELKTAEMIKLPIILAEHESWQNAVNGAVASRAVLEEAARGEADYIRPIVLLQAQPRNEEVTVEVLKKHLIDVEQIPEERIAIATGDQRELDGIDLFDPKCPIEHVITVEALKEGWDCSFAYVFCSVQRIQSATDAEQLLGRVLRMPYAKRRVADSLNRAYAHVSEASFGAAASSLADKLVAMGFEEDEAKDAIEPAQGHLDETGLFAPRERPKPTFKHTVQASQELVQAIGKRDRPNVSLRYTDEGEHEIQVSGRVDAELEEDIASALPEREQRAFREAVRRYRVDIKDQLSPAEQGETFTAPRLMAWVQGEFEFADTDVFMEFHDWRPSDHPARLDEGEFSIRETARSFEIDVDGNRVTYQFADEAEQLALDVDVEGWTPQNLVLWLDRQLRQPDINQSDLLRWLTDCIGHLGGVRKLHVAALMRTKFILARKLRDRIAAARAAERNTIYQRYLFAPEAKVDVSFDHAFAFRDGMYADQKRHRYSGRFRFTKHFLGADAVPAFDGTEAGEEFQCAQALDSLPKIKFWIRNVARHPQSFWLPTASDKFYPDFIAQLNDGRRFVVEYKGALLAGAGIDDTNEKRAIGRLWETGSKGEGLFLVVEKEVEGRDMRNQMLDKIGA